MLTSARQHFITDCPERTKPPEGYICRICNTVTIPLFSAGSGNLRSTRSRAILSAIVQQSTRLEIRVAKNLEKVTSVELVEVRSTTWKIALSRSKVKPNDLVEILQRRSLVRPLFVVSRERTHLGDQPMNAGSVYRIPQLRELISAKGTPCADLDSNIGNISLWRLVPSAM